MKDESPTAQAAGRRHLAIAYIGSFLIFSAFPVFRLDRESRTLPCCTDHSAHWGASILMAFNGLDIYRRPVKELCTKPSASQRAANPLADCTVPSHPSIAPFSVNWQQYPRVYPPGAMLLAAPEALLFGLSLIHFDLANLLIVLTILLGAHLASLAIFLCLWRSGADNPAWRVVVLCIVMPLVHLQLVDGALRGIYDPVPALLIVAGALLVSSARPVAGVLAISVAMFLHFRALWYVPLLMLALYRTYETRSMWMRGGRSWVALGVSGALLAITLWCFMVLQPALHSFHLTNPVGIKAFRTDPGLILSAGVPVGGVLAALAWNRSWLTAAVASWQLLVLLQTREVQQWHALLLLPMIGIAALERRASQAAVIAVLVLYFWEFRVAFSGWPLSGDTLADLLRV